MLLFQVHPCTKETKPQWLVEKHAGKMPCLVNGDDIITESSDIALYLDKTHPEPPLASGPQVDQISQQISGFFPAMARFVKSVEHSQELEDKLLVELETLDKLVAESKGKFVILLQTNVSTIYSRCLPLRRSSIFSRLSHCPKVISFENDA